MVLFIGYVCVFPGLDELLSRFLIRNQLTHYMFEILGRHVREDGAAILIVFDRLIGIKYGRGKDWVNLQEKKRI